MQTATVANQTPVNEPARKQKTSSPDAFALTLLNTQADTARTNAGNLTDASGLNPHGGEAPKSARRERIDQETNEARAAEAKQSRPGTETTDLKSERTQDRASTELRPANERGNSAMDDTLKAKNTAAASEQTIAKLASEQSALRVQPQSSTEDASTPRTDLSNQASTKAKSEAVPTASTTSEPVGENSSVIAVTTAGAARAGSASSTSASNPAQAIGKLLAASNESARAEQPVVANEQAARQGSSDSKSSSESTKASRQGESNASKGAGGSDAPRRADFQQLVRNLRIANARGESSATLRLEPPDLGKMRVEVRMQQDSLRLRIEVDSQSARDLIQSRSAELTAALREHNIHVERFEILSVDESGDGRMANHADSDGANSNSAESQNTNSGGANESTTTVADEIVETSSTVASVEEAARDAKALDMNA